ncbi:hypothetical protein [Levilactobacillus brevis]|uniref:hypothetical protein n=1 Tax=Levilactobacillus brevis TaxID=1580 RepID=UPI000A2FEA09|nr:hypothetical protein [Levilactobacillus brevis]ARQ92191.1 hypothetical protein A6F60_00020 [Levilactobacillus brevis]ARQ94290.1 hypothetical protein A6F60_11530 [Levilactobacillus brevis]
MTAPVVYKNLSWINDGLSKYFDPKDLKDFVKSKNIKADTSRKGNVVLFLDYLNNRMTKEEQDVLVSDFENLLMDNYSEKCNKILGICYMNLRKGAFSKSAEEFTNDYLEGTRHFLNILNAKLLTSEFKMVYYDLQEDSGEITRFDVLYARVYSRKKDPQHERIELVKVSFDMSDNKVMFYFPYPVTNTTDRVPHTPYGIFYLLRQKILNDYKVEVSNKDTETQVFEIYKKYTESNEQVYVQRVGDADTGLTDNYYQNMVKNLHVSPLKSKGSGYIDRIKRIFVRALVDSDFQSFVEHIKKSTGFITGFIYHDDSGSSITGKNGSGAKLDDIEIDPLQASNTYLDTRDTIYSSNKLFSVRVKFNPKKIDLTFLYDVRITAYHDLLTIHFIQNSVEDANKEYVFQQLKSII